MTKYKILETDSDRFINLNSGYADVENFINWIKTEWPNKDIFFEEYKKVELEKEKLRLSQLDSKRNEVFEVFDQDKIYVEEHMRMIELNWDLKGLSELIVEYEHLFDKYGNDRSGSYNSIPGTIESFAIQFKRILDLHNQGKLKFFLEIKPTEKILNNLKEKTKLYNQFTEKANKIKEKRRKSDAEKSELLKQFKQLSVEEMKYALDRNKV